MATKKAAAPALTRVSPGVYRDAKGNLVNSPNGSAPASKPANKNANKQANKPIQAGGPPPQEQLQAEQGLIRSSEGLNAEGLDVANRRLSNGSLQTDFAPQTIDRISTGDSLDQRNKVEDAVYQRLTRYNAQDKQKEMEQKKQELYNQGIQYSEDPNSRYQHEIGDLNRRYDANNADALNASFQFGGNEQAQQVGINESVIGNQFNQQLQGRQQNVGEIGQLAGVGLQTQGQLVGQQQAQQGIKQNQTALRQNQQQIDQANRRLGSGGQQQQAPQQMAIPIA